LRRSGRGRPIARSARDVYTIALAPGSLYLLTGEARSAWRHSLRPVTALRGFARQFKLLR